MNQEEKISGKALALLMVATILGVRFLSLPRDIARISGADGWLAVLTCGVLLPLLIWLAYRLARYFPDQDVIQYSQALLGRLPGQLFGWLLVLFVLMITAINIRMFSDVIKVFLLSRTPLDVVVIAMLLTCLPLVTGGAESIARIVQLFVPLVLIFFFAIIMGSLYNADFGELLPVLEEGWRPVLAGLPLAVTNFIGLGVIYFFFPNVKKDNQDKLGPWLLAGVMLPWLVITILVIVSQAVFGREEIGALLYPIVSLSMAATLPASAFLERLDLFFIIFWILSSFNSIAITYYLAIRALQQLLGLAEPQPLAWQFLPLLYFLAMVPENMEERSTLLLWLSYVGGIFVFLYPLGLLLPLAWWQRRKGP